MDTEIKETVEQLYALRAGLSLASLEYDEVEKIKGEIKEKSEKAEVEISEKSTVSLKHKTDAERIRDDRVSINQSNISKNRARESELSIWQENYDEYSKAFNKARMKISVIIFCFLLAVCVSIGSIVLMSKYKMDYDYKSTIGFASFCVSGIAMVGLGAGFFSIKDEAPSFKNKKRVAGQKIKELQAEAVRAEYSEKDVLHMVSEDVDYINHMRESSRLQEEIVAMEEAIAEKQHLAEREIQVYSKKGKAIYDSLVPQFSSLLDERDWKNIDLVIYYLETGRAKTMQEALQQVDLYRHTEQITSALEYATGAICETIRKGMSHLSGVISTCTGKMITELKEIQKNQAYIEHQLVLNNESIEQLISEQRLQNALVKKSYETSEKMMGNISKMREYADEAYFANRNKWYRE